MSRKNTIPTGKAELDAKASDRIGRRNLLLAGAFGAAAIVLDSFRGEIWEMMQRSEEPETIGSSPDDTPVNHVLANFPDAKEIPYMRAVEKIGNPKAKKLIVIFRDVHGIENMSPDVTRKVEQCQSESYACMSYFMDHPTFAMKKIYAEGVSDYVVELMHEANRLKAEFREETGTDLPVEDTPWAIPKPARSRLESERGLITLAGEDPVLNKKHKSDSNSFAADNKMMDDRDQFVLERMMADPDEISFVVFGAGHDFKDNVQEWNKKNPEKIISMVLLTTKSVKKFDTAFGR